MIKRKINLNVYSSIDEFVRYCVEYVLNNTIMQDNFSEDVKLFSTALYSNIYSSLRELGVEFVNADGSLYPYSNINPITIKTKFVKLCKDFEIKVSRHLVEQSYPFDTDLRFSLESLSDKEWNSLIESFISSIELSGGYIIE